MIVYNQFDHTHGKLCQYFVSYYKALIIQYKTSKFKKIYTRYIAYWISQFRPQQHWFMAIINAEVFQEDSSYV